MTYKTTEAIRMFCDQAKCEMSLSMDEAQEQYDLKGKSQWIFADDSGGQFHFCPKHANAEDSVKIVIQSTMRFGGELFSGELTFGKPMLIKVDGKIKFSIMLGVEGNTQIRSYDRVNDEWTLVSETQNDEEDSK